MKYIKITGDFLWGKNEITKNDLVSSDTIIDLDNLTHFVKDENKWKPINHE